MHETFSTGTGTLGVVGLPIIHTTTKEASGFAGVALQSGNNQRQPGMYGGKYLPYLT